MKYNQKKNQDYTRTTIIVALLKDLGEVVDLGINSKMVNGLQGSVKILWFPLRGTFSHFQFLYLLFYNIIFH